MGVFAMTDVNAPAKASHWCRWPALLGLLMVAWPASSRAEIDQWFGEDGVSHFSQEPPSEGRYRMMIPNPVPPRDAEAAQKRLESLLQQQKASQEARESRQREQQKKGAPVQRPKLPSARVYIAHGQERHKWQIAVKTRVAR